MDYLTENNKGYTVFEGKGAKENVNQILIITQRKEGKQIIEDVKRMCNDEVFITTSDVSRFVGGHGI